MSTEASYNAKTDSIILQSWDIETCKSIPGLRAKGAGEWRSSAVWSVYAAIRAVFGTDLTQDKALTDWAAEQSVWMEEVKALALRRPIDAEGSERLYGYQRVGVQYLSKAKKGLLALVMGSGKTLLAIEALNTLPDTFPALIVSPSSVRISWAAEWRKWSPDTKVEVLQGTKAQREKILANFQGDVLLVGWEQLRLHSRLAPWGSIKMKAGDKVDKEFNTIPWKTVIADEVHRIADPSASWTRALWAVAHGKTVQYRWGMTGTPQRNNAGDLWSIMHFISPEEFPTRTAWLNRYCNTKFSPFGPPIITDLNQTNEAELRETLDVRMLRWPEEAVLAMLPPKTYEKRQVILPPALRKAYNELRDKALTELDDEEATQVIAFNPLTLLARLSQLSCASLELLPPDPNADEDTPPKFRMVEPSPKLDALDEVLSDLDESEQVVVFAVSRQLIHLAEKRFDKDGTTYASIHGQIDTAGRIKALDDFEQGRVRVLLCTVGAGSEGLNLQKARYLVFLQRSFSYTMDSQAEARVHRRGQERPVVIIDIEAERTVDQRVREALATKGEGMAVMTRDRERLKYFLDDGG